MRVWRRGARHCGRLLRPQLRLGLRVCRRHHYCHHSLRRRAWRCRSCHVWRRCGRSCARGDPRPRHPRLAGGVAESLCLLPPAARARAPRPPRGGVRLGVAGRRLRRLRHQPLPRRGPLARAGLSFPRRRWHQLRRGQVPSASHRRTRFRRRWIPRPGRLRLLPPAQRPHPSLHRREPAARSGPPLCHRGEQHLLSGRLRPV
mmetsp:Transcript_38253/g.123796  ORF Transcript_38253/g.123796 Transcript_38253/m.123796 type:complete len:202 (-) Transcript_38253:376-981(-)